MELQVISVIPDPPESSMQTTTVDSLTTNTCSDSPDIPPAEGENKPTDEEDGLNFNEDLLCDEHSKHFTIRHVFVIKLCSMLETF